MKIFTHSFTVLALLVAATNGLDLVTQNDVTQESQASQVGQANPVQQSGASQAADSSPKQSGHVQEDSCTLTGNYIQGTNVSHCETIVIDSLSVPAGVTLDLTNLWGGPLLKLKGTSLSVTGPGTLDGQGVWYWPQGQKVTKPVFFKLNRVSNSTLSGFTIKNSPFRTFSIGNSNYTTLTRLTLNSTAGNGVAKNTDGFDLSRNDHITITGNKIFNQDDCLAMQCSTNTLFSRNYCSGGHGISIGSLGGDKVDDSDTVTGLLVKDNTIVNSDNGIRIKTITGLTGLVKDIAYLNNKVVNVENAIGLQQNQGRTQGLSGSAMSLYDIVANPDAVSNWSFTKIVVNATNRGNCTGEPITVKC
ncbi:polygalacturonase [Phytophthora sojae]|uniref:endo-polygalacturonase n=1 Tax=Phytophthora sojae (strain P6497) TaxID=1094619 RepID=G4ZL42_PHYSP|nr:polygalacturonase [Phytophthora sojae]EGZ15264.1 polygalacturonase [Phytophthora sojae]|eukprot:XP_009529013.1 polygalacturonase [Phytophthora sojae]